MRETAWSTDEPCPICEAGLILIDYGRAMVRAECRSCGYVAPCDTGDGNTAGQW